MPRTTKISAFLMVGLLIVGIAIFSGELGLNPGWGKGRIALLSLGLFVLLFPWLFPKKAGNDSFQSDLFAFPALLIVIAVYLWFISISRETTSNYYALLADSFRHGQLSLPLRPDPALLALPDPYDPAARQGIKAPLDLALYKGKFYLYWGPAPALVVALLKPLSPGQVSDGYLLFAFVCGIFISQFLLIRYLWERFFPEIPKWLVLLSIFIAGLINPMLWLLSQPKIYETAIAGGQFFFMAGLLSTLTAWDRPTPSPGRLALAGIFWSLAVGTRSVLVFPILFMTLMVVYQSYKRYRASFIKLVTDLIPFGVPLLVGAVAFSWYNWARFGSVSETGFRYALAGPHLQAHLDKLFSPAYIFQNLYNYLLNPFAIQRSFPFLYLLRGTIERVLPWAPLPEFYAAQAITGVLLAAPFTVLALAAVAMLFNKKRANLSNEVSTIASLNWIATGLLGSFLFSLFCLLTFFWVAMRYAEDFMPALTLLSILGFWYGYQSLSQSTAKRKGFALVGSTLAVFSLAVGILLALSNYFSNGLL